MLAYRFAHFSDPHLPLDPDRLRGRQWLSKRLFGYLSWRRKRHAQHSPAVLAALIADVRATRPDHVVVTGDIANIALPAEFARGLDWLTALGGPADVTLVPGNHDTLVPLPWAQGLGLWRPWMQGDDGAALAADRLFPAVRVRGPVAFVGLNSGLPTPPLLATGTLGGDQLRAAEEVLWDLGRRGLFRVVLLHHPVGRGVVSARKGLTDAPAFRQMLSRVGAELLLHGHAHRPSLTTLAGPLGPVPSLTAPSASAVGPDRAHAARWHDVLVRRDGAGWRAAVTVRGLVEGDGKFATLGRYELLLPAVRPPAVLAA